MPNRCNYIHWIEDLLVSEIIAKANTSVNNARGFDIGTGANCIYPLLGASLLGWSFVGSGNCSFSWCLFIRSDFEKLFKSYLESNGGLIWWSLLQISLTLH